MQIKSALDNCLATARQKYCFGRQQEPADVVTESIAGALSTIVLPICAFENFCRAGGAGFCPTENSLVLAGAIPATKNLFGEPAGADRNADSANCRSTISNRFFNFDSV
jgi:hypothetical protein